MKLIFAAGVLAAFVQSQPPALRIVVLEGEGAVNIIQQKTAVRPLVEIRDRNNVPVTGATVTFTIGGGGQSAAFAGGAQTLTVTTNAAGQAAAGSLNALGSGAFQIQVQAAYQGQLATAAISQTNFATAAAASQAGAATAGGTGGSTSGAAGGAAGGGGGISGTTIGIVGAAIAGGAVAATQVAKSGGDEGEGFDAYHGSFSSQFLFTSVGPASTCVFTRLMTGTITIDLRTDAGGGRAYVEGSQIDQGVSGGGCSVSTTPVTFTTPDTTATGGPSALAFSNFRPGAGQNTRVTFNGSFSGNTITGSLTVEITSQTTSSSPGGTATFNGSGSATVAVTLQR